MGPFNAIITGANRGIGLELVHQLIDIFKISSSSSSNIFATYRNKDESKELFDLADKTSKHAASSVTIHPIQLDVSDESSYPRVLEHVTSVISEKPNSLIVVHNAGLMHRPGSLSSTSKQQLIDAYEVNAVAPLLLTRSFLPLLKSAASTATSSEFSWLQSSVIIISALWGSPSFNTQGGIPYSYGMSKAAVNFASKSLGIDLKSHKILTVALHPGWVKTRMGGDEAPIDLVESVRQMLTVALPKVSNEASTGGFFNYDGRPLKY